MARGVLFFALFSALLAVAGAQSLHSLSLRDTNNTQYAFLDPILKDVQVLSLAESIHLTREFPITRLGVLRRAHEHSGFSVLAFEGSAIDLWVSQDLLLRKPSDTGGATSGLFGLWNTEEIRRVFEYEVNTWSTPQPMYISAYDIQPGTGLGSQGARVFALLGDELTQYAPAPSSIGSFDWISALVPLTSACATYTAASEEPAQRAIAFLEQWIALANPPVQKAYPSVPMHGKALALLPENLRASLALCRALGPSSNGQRKWSNYKRLRDTYAAQYALALKSASPERKIALWAHVSHLFYDEDHTNTSVGELLRAVLGPKLYTIGALAFGGGTTVIFDDTKDDFGYAFVHGVSATIRSQLSKECPEACFIDLRGADVHSEYRAPQAVWIESGVVSMRLASNFDGLIWIRHVHPPHMPAILLLYLMTKHYLVALLVLLCLLVAFLVIWKLLRRRTAH